MPQRARGSKKSTSGKTMKDAPGGGARQKPGVRVRAHRDDTPETRRQRRATPKTHPTRNPVASRKD